jgi:hypothetical protein
VERLEKGGIPPHLVAAVAQSGYFDAPFMAGYDGAILDGYYGVKQSGVFELEEFLQHLKGKVIETWPRGTRIYHHVHSWRTPNRSYDRSATEDMRRLEDYASEGRHENTYSGGLCPILGSQTPTARNG